MKISIVCFVLALVSSSVSKPAPEESVVSVYTTEANTSGTYSIDVYRQIADNLVERITAPFHRLFNPEKNKTETRAVTKKPSRRWEDLELLDDPTPTKPNTEDNEIQVRDTEELSQEALNRNQDKKPEKISLNYYLPVNEHLENLQSTTTEDFTDITFDDVEETARVEGPLIFLLELIGSFIQLVQGAFSSIFKPNTSTSDDPK